jgi:hypothetical protein
MKLRNKKTGEIKSIEEIIRDAFLYNELDSLKSIDTNWEDYKPLIKDEKIRKAVRAWAEANLMKKVMFEYIENEGSYFNDCSCSIRFYEDLHLTNRHEYTIEELCGEEEE